MFLDDVVTDGEPQTGPLANLLGGKKRLKYAGQMFRSADACELSHVSMMVRP